MSIHSYPSPSLVSSDQLLTVMGVCIVFNHPSGAILYALQPQPVSLQDLADFCAAASHKLYVSGTLSCYSSEEVEGLKAAVAARSAGRVDVKGLKGGPAAQQG